MCHEHTREVYMRIICLEKEGREEKTTRQEPAPAAAAAARELVDKGGLQQRKKSPTIVNYNFKGDSKNRATFSES